MSYFDPAAAAEAVDGAPVTPTPQIASTPGPAAPAMSPLRGFPHSAPPPPAPGPSLGPEMDLAQLLKAFGPPATPTPQVASMPAPQQTSSQPSYEEWLKSMYVPQGPPLPSVNDLRKNAETVKAKKAPAAKAPAAAPRAAMPAPNPHAEALRHQASAMQFDQVMQELGAQARQAQVEPIVNNEREHALFQEMLKLYGGK